MLISRTRRLASQGTDVDVALATEARIFLLYLNLPRKVTLGTNLTVSFLVTDFELEAFVVKVALAIDAVTLIFVDSHFEGADGTTGRLS